MPFLLGPPQRVPPCDAWLCWLDWSCHCGVVVPSLLSTPRWGQLWWGKEQPQVTFRPQGLKWVGVGDTGRGGRTHPLPQDAGWQPSLAPASTELKCGLGSQRRVGERPGARASVLCALPGRACHILGCPGALEAAVPSDWGSCLLVG